MEIVNDKTEEKREVDDSLKISPPEDIEANGTLTGTGENFTKEVKEEEYEEVFSLVEKMIVKCATEGGVGLAAPQIGVKKKLFVFMFNEGMYQAVINPKIFPEGHKKVNMIEACLSYPGKRYYVQNRFKNVRMVYYTINRQEKKLMRVVKSFHGMSAIVAQHEFDHLNGITIATRGVLIEDESRKKEIKLKGQGE
jgi:peptide deformylase